jgi:hypothetical protein
MPFTPGHKKHGGRKAGTPNRTTAEVRELARRLLGDAQYQQSLQKRLIRGEAGRMELFLWEQAYGKPCVEPDRAPERAAGNGDLLQILEKLEQAKKSDPTPPRPAPRGAARRDARDQDEELS